jgi:tetratricopeptide (TPR) repeat protein
MAEITSSSGLPPNQQAEQHYQNGLSLKTSGDADAALTEFRRAALLNPDHFEAQMETGRLCKLRARVEPIYFRHTFEAFRQAARINLTHTEAHDEYITAAQKLERLDELLQEYDTWIKFNPDNPLLVRCRKNILTISMALMPDAVKTNSSNSGKTRKFTTFFVVGILVIGIVLLGLILFLKKKPPRYDPRPIPSDIEVVR